MKKKTGEDFKKQSKEKKITKWIIHNCSMCNYGCGFIIGWGKTGVGYDNGCSCSWSGVRPSSWNDIAEHYNLQTNKKVIKEMNKFWGFK